MIEINDKRPQGMWINGKRVAFLFTAARKIWEAIRSCFGSGIWREAKSWSDTDKWKEN